MSLVAPGDRIAPAWRAATAQLVCIGALAVVLAGCSTAPRAPARGGGFYQGDGPPAQVPADIMATPDAVPKVEPFHPYANRPYVALGRSYTPITDDRPLVQRGLASWYGRQFHGNRTASGELYDMFAMSAAHPTMPLPSYARVTNLRTGEAVIVRVNDRGPFKDGRVVDLSYAAAMRLGIAAVGTGEVQVERITHQQIALGAPKPISTATATVRPDPANSGMVEVPAGARLSWMVQLGAFELAANAEALREQIAERLSLPQAADLPAAGLAPRVERDGALHRVLIGSLPDRATAADLAMRLASLLGRETSLFLR